MRLNAVQAMGAGILAILAMLNMSGQAHAAGLTAGQRASADWYAEAALSDTTTETRSFRRCIRNGSRVYTRGVFVGRQCVASDGERWYAGLTWVNGKPRLNTGP